jgi:hypothetical protein
LETLESVPDASSTPLLARARAKWEWQREG